MPNRGGPARMRYSDRTLTGILFFFGSTQFMLALVVAEGTLPAYSEASNAISDLGVGPTAPLFNTSVVLLGLLTIAAAYFYHRTHRGLWITMPFFLAGMGPIGVGLFPETALVAHTVFAFMSFFFGNLLAVLFALHVPAPFRYVSLLLGGIGFVALALVVAEQYAGLGFGGIERMIIYPVLLWDVAAGGYLMSTAGIGPAKSVRTADP